MQFSLWTFALQVINFLILVWLLQRFLYKPVREILEKRRTLVDAKLEEARKSKETAEEEKQRLEQDRKQFESERDKRLADLHNELAGETDKLLAEARAKAEKIVEQGRRRIETERAEALKTLKAEIANLAADMAAKILSERPSDSSPAFRKFDDYISNLSEDDERKLRSGLNESGATVQVVTAELLDEAMREKWRRQLSTKLGVNNDVAFETDGALIGGAEVRFPHAVIKLSLADGLIKLKERALSK